MAKRISDNEFWITNISNMNVSLSDLGLTVPARRSMNLLDSRHHSLSKELLLTSAESGSLYKKRNKIVVRKVPPVSEARQLLEVAYNAAVATRRRSAVKVEEVHYEELDVSDDEFAMNAADLVDHKY